MNTVPIVFCFDRGLTMPAVVCLTSLLKNAAPTTFYDIYIIVPPRQEPFRTAFEALAREYGNCRVTFRNADDTFENSFEIRGINCVTYYRLLIPELVPEYDKVLYSDVDVIFRDDLSGLYATDLGDNYIGAVRNLAHFDKDTVKYYKTVGIDPYDSYYDGNLVINSAAMRRDGLADKFREHAGKQYKFQDMDIYNIVCRGRILSMSPELCVTTGFAYQAVFFPNSIKGIWPHEQIERALEHGIVHYNGEKPWRGNCYMQDIWWEYYRGSAAFDRRFYQAFFFNRLRDLDCQPLWKRVKTVWRYFVPGRAERLK